MVDYRIACIALLPLLAGAGEPPVADLICVNGNIYTMDARCPRAEAIAILDGRILAVGSNTAVRRYRGDATREVDLRGHTVLPGLIDSHCHVAGLGSFGLGRIDLSDAGSFDGLLAAVEQRVKQARPGEWILGGRWDHESWPDRRLPVHQRLSAISPVNPVWLTRVDGHAGLANAAAMQAAGITRDTPAPAGGEILKDANGEPTGVFIDNAEALIERVVPGGRHEPAQLILKAQSMCLAVGLTGVHDAGVSPTEIDVYRRLVDAGTLRIRVYAMVNGEAAPAHFADRGTLVSDRLTVRAAKLYADGALGSRGALLLAPYADRPTDDQGRPYVGLRVMPAAYIRRVALDGLRRGYQVCTHAIGDAANREVLDAYEDALRVHARPDHRFRIEHAQVLALDDIPRFAELGVLPAMQPTHCTSDMRWVDDRIGPQRSRGAYAWASLRRTGTPIPGGSDFPVESHNPFLGLYAAITRQNAAGEPAGGWHASERMTREEALRSFTLDAAFSAFEEDRKGSLEPGKFADSIVIDRDVMICPPRDILETRVLATYIDGRPAYTVETETEALAPRGQNRERHAVAGVRRPQAGDAADPPTAPSVVDHLYSAGSLGF